MPNNRDKHPEARGPRLETRGPAIVEGCTMATRTVGRPDNHGKPKAAN